MYLGHALLAFTLGALGARWLAVRRERALLAGALAAGYAVVPDVDGIHTAVVVLRERPARLFPTPTYVWTDASWLVHRSLTHSLLVGAATVALVWLASAAAGGRGPRWTRWPLVLGAAGGAGALLRLGFAADAWPGLGVLALYLAGALGLAVLAARRDPSPTLVAGAAAVGLLTHPFGDLFMGRPPAFLYPLSTASPVDQLALAADPTVNLVGLFLLEVGLAWSALSVAARLRGTRLLPAVAPRAALAVGFAATALVIQPPTLLVAYHFAAGALSTGLVLGFLPPLARTRGLERDTAFAGAATGLAAVALAAVGYLVAYLALVA